MKYPQEHWEKVAKLYSDTPIHPSEVRPGQTYEEVLIAKMQNRYPDITINTMERWVKVCRDKGLIG